MDCGESGPTASRPASQLGRHRVVLVPWYQVPGRTRFGPLCYQDQLRQSPELPGTVLVALGALPV